jgi:hypothetical protein
MNKLASFACGAALFLGVTAQVRAYDPEADYRDPELRRRTSEENARYLEILGHGMPIAYYPTMHYYSKEGTIVYNFVPLDRSGVRRVSVADSVLLSPAEISHTGSNTRVILHQHRLAFRETKKVTPLNTQGPISPETTPAVRPTPPDTVTPAAPAPADTPVTPAPAPPAGPAPAK